MPDDMNTLNCLSDIPFLITTDGRMDVRQALLRAHTPHFDISTNIAGYHYSAQIRLLAATAAICLRFETDTTPRGIRNLLTSGLSTRAVDFALSTLEPGTRLHDPDFPFMQRPALNLTNPKAKSTYVGPGEQPVKKLSPSMPPDEGEEFSNLLLSSPRELSQEDAVLQLVTYHHLSVAGNNAYNGDKCVSGSPAMRFVGADNSATEVLWHGLSLLETLLCMIPRSWVEGEGLPAWADRTCTRSREHDCIHPLWAATWSSNTPATAWRDNKLVGVRTGGVPAEWILPEMGDKNQQKEWWTTRNEADPFYLYRYNGKELKLQRLDLGKDATALATSWAADNNTGAYTQWCVPRMLPPRGDTTLAFVRHRLEGTASSPNIRASEVFIPHIEQWAHDTDIDVEMRISEGAACIQRLHSLVTGPFRREHSNERANGRVPLVLDFLESSRNSVSEAFWRHMTDSFSLLLKECRDSEATYIPSQKLCTSLMTATIAAYDDVTQPYFGQEPARISHVRAGIARLARYCINQFAAPESSE